VGERRRQGSAKGLAITLIGWIFLLREHVSLGEARRAPGIAAASAG
jgi:hypothetical protein